MNKMNNMEENFNDSHSKTHMDPMEDANKTERLDEQSGKISNAFNDMKKEVADKNDKDSKEKRRRESDARKYTAELNMTQYPEELQFYNYRISEYSNTHETENLLKTMDRMNKMDNKKFDFEQNPKMDKFKMDRKPEQLDQHFGKFDDLKKDMKMPDMEGSKCCEKKRECCHDEEQPMDKRRESDARNKEM